MATKTKSKTKPKETEEMVPEVKPQVKLKKSDVLMTTGWVLLLIAGLGHMMPTQLGPVLTWGVFGVSIQMIVGVGSVIVALYYLLEE